MVTQPAINIAHIAFVLVLAGASVHANALQAVEPTVVLTMQGPSDPMRPVHPWVIVYVLQIDKADAHPLPIETQPNKNAEQAIFVANVFAASVQTRGLHTVELAVVFAVQGPSEPIIPMHPFAWLYELHPPKDVTQPFPVVRHPTIHLLHYVEVVYVAGASEHILSIQVPNVPLAIHLQDFAPDVARFPK